MPAPSESNDDESPLCPACGSVMEIGALHGTPWLLWGDGDSKPGRFGTTIGAERLGTRATMTKSSWVRASRCTSCRTGHFAF